MQRVLKPWLKAIVNETSTSPTLKISLHLIGGHAFQLLRLPFPPTERDSISAFGYLPEYSMSTVIYGWD